MIENWSWLLHCIWFHWKIRSIWVCFGLCLLIVVSESVNCKTLVLSLIPHPVPTTMLLVFHPCITVQINTTSRGIHCNQLPATFFHSWKTLYLPLGGFVMQVVHRSQLKYRFANRCVWYFKPYFGVINLTLLWMCIDVEAI